MNWTLVQQALTDEAARQSLDQPALDQAEDMVLLAYNKWHPEKWKVQGVEWRYDQVRDRADASGVIDPNVIDLAELVQTSGASLRTLSRLWTGRPRVPSTRPGRNVRLVPSKV